MEHQQGRQQGGVEVHGGAPGGGLDTIQQQPADAGHQGVRHSNIDFIMQDTRFRETFCGKLELLFCYQRYKE